MRVLEVDGFFRLPDDWEGTFADALRLLADYHEGPGKERRELRPPKTTRDDAWDKFLASTKESFRVYMGIGLCEVSGSTTTELQFNDCPTKTGETQ